MNVPICHANFAIEIAITELSKGKLNEYVLVRQYRIVAVELNNAKVNFPENHSSPSTLFYNLIKYYFDVRSIYAIIVVLDKAVSKYYRFNLWYRTLATFYKLGIAATLLAYTN